MRRLRCCLQKLCHNMTEKMFTDTLCINSIQKKNSNLNETFTHEYISLQSLDLDNYINIYFFIFYLFIYLFIYLLIYLFIYLFTFSHLFIIYLFRFSKNVKSLYIHYSILISQYLSSRLIRICFKQLQPHDMSRVMRKPTNWFPNRSNENRAVQARKIPRGLKYGIYKVAAL